MQVIAVNPDAPRPDRLEPAIAALEAGRLIALPTETLYGLAADAFNSEALRALNRIKRKAADSPILLLVADREQVQQVCSSLPPQFASLTEMFWPGPLTVVVPAAPDLPREVSGGRETVAVRMPGLTLPRRLAAELGRPISGVSANLHGEPPCRTALEVARVFTDGVEMILDGGATASGAPSTVLDLCGSRPRLTRAGVVPVSALRSFLPDLEEGPL